MSTQTGNQTAGTTTSSVPQSDADYVEYAYETALGRSSDQAGKAYWLEELNTGLVDRNALMEALSSSPEGHAHSATGAATSPAAGSTTATPSVPQSDADYVEYAYQTALGRSSDQAGKAYWLEELNTGLVDRNSLMEALNSSPEAHTHSATGTATSPAAGSTTATPSVPQSDADYVEYAYQTALGRSSDQAGKAYWLEELHTGLVDRNSLMEALNSSPEAHTHLTLAGVAPVAQGTLI